jgi:heat shock protein HslJ
MSLVRLAALIGAAVAMTASVNAQMPGGKPAQPATQPPGQAPGQQKPAAAPSREKQFPVPSSWTALSLNGKPFTGRDRPTFMLDQQFRAKGFGGCNTYSATSYPLREQRIAVGPLALTKKLCEKDIMDVERAFLVALRTSIQWEYEGTTLVVKTQSGDLRFERSI